MNIYLAERHIDDRGATVEANGAPLNPRLDLVNHSPDGFEWGYSGSGPAQLALAILAVEFDDDFAVAHHQKFKEDFIAPISQHLDDWGLESDSIQEWGKQFSPVAKAD